MSAKATLSSVIFSLSQLAYFSFFFLEMQCQPIWNWDKKKKVLMLLNNIKENGRQIVFLQELFVMAFVANSLTSLHSVPIA